MELRLGDQKSAEISLSFDSARGITISATYEDGDGWEIITLTPQGTFIRHGYVAPGVFELDEMERIVEVEEGL